MSKGRRVRTEVRAIADLKPDPLNANRGTPRGREALDRSLREYGPGRSILIDRRGVILAGNKTVERAQALKLNVPVSVVACRPDRWHRVDRRPARRSRSLDGSTRAGLGDCGQPGG
jgi:hypothetical protein